jgi:hypothetical protein
MAAARGESTLPASSFYRKSSSSFIYPFVLLKDSFGFRRKCLDTLLKPISATGSRLCSSTGLHPATDRFADCKIKEVTINVVCRI